MDIIERIRRHIYECESASCQEMEPDPLPLLLACRDEIIAARACAEMMLQGTGQKVCESMALRVLDRQWIPVAQRLPDDETELLVAFEDRSLGVAFAVFHHLDEDEGPKWTDGSGVELKQPTHWMPLPEPPEVK